MVRTLVKLLVAALVVHACWRCTGVAVRYYRFKDAVHEMVLFSSAKSDVALEARVLELAEQSDVPIKRDSVRVHHVQNHIVVNAAYTDQVELLPTKFYPFDFTVNVDVLDALQPPGGAPETGR
jgi:hypothetical protein